MTSATSVMTIGNPTRPMFKSVFDLMDFEDADDEGYVIGTYNGISITMTANMESFRLNDIYRTLSMKTGKTKASKDPYEWKRSEDGAIYLADPVYSPLIKTITKPKAIAGLYAPICHFYMFLFDCAKTKVQRWLDGREWEGECEEGCLYLVQPVKYLGTTTYKFGESWNKKQRFVAYNKTDTKTAKKVDEIKVAKVLHRHAAETILMTHARMNFEQSPAGKEYFIVPNIEDAKTVFDEALIEIRNKGL